MVTKPFPIGEQRSKVTFQEKRASGEDREKMMAGLER